MFVTKNDSFLYTCTQTNAQMSSGLQCLPESAKTFQAGISFMTFSEFHKDLRFSCISFTFGIIFFTNHPLG